MNKEQNLTVREATIFVIEQSYDGFEVLKDSMLVAATAFEEDNNTTAIEIIHEKITQSVADLCRFCGTVQLYYSDVLGEDIGTQFAQELIKLEKNMNEMITTLEEQNYVDCADILRFDFISSIDNLIVIFPKIKEAFQTSSRSDLDKL